MTLMFSSLSFNNYQYVMTLISCKPLSNLPKQSCYYIYKYFMCFIFHMYFLSKITTILPPLKKKSVLPSKHHLISTVLMGPLFSYIFKTLLIHRFLLCFPLPSLLPHFLPHNLYYYFVFVAKETQLFAQKNSPGLDFAIYVAMMVSNAFLFPLNYL